MAMKYSSGFAAGCAAAAVTIPIRRSRLQAQRMTMAIQADSINPIGLRAKRALPADPLVRVGLGGMARSSTPG